MLIREQKNFHNVLVVLRLIIVQRFTIHIVSGLSVNLVEFEFEFESMFIYSVQYKNEIAPTPL